MTRSLRLGAIATLLVLLSLAAACGGGDDQATATPAPLEATSTSERTSEAAGEAEFELRIGGNFVAPDAHAFTYDATFAGASGTIEAVIIGDVAWIRVDAGEWEERTRDAPAVLVLVNLSSADPDFLVDQDFVANLQTLDGEPDSINGVATTRYFIPRETVSELAGLFGGSLLDDAGGLTDLEMTIWLEEETEGLVRAEFAAIGTAELLGEGTLDVPPDAEVTISLTIDLTQINDPTISIEPPIESASVPAQDDADHVFESFHYTVEIRIDVFE